ncbi:MAG: adenylate/guanylate cyclase domain-containing protein [Nitratireductor sp.]|uniref:adenylate/guanylate cyclase domain-containing protein n=1 Tax=Parasphingorhabdus sp. TaxID=2709688 RepID=UPI0032665665
MSQHRVQRRLAAILVADIVGYSRMIRADEAATLARLKQLRGELLDPKIDEYGGRLVKSTGDGLLAEFPSAVDAVQYAVDVQDAIAAQTPETDDEPMCLRIGINLGDVVVDGGDLLGDGVNVAARIEGIAQPGGICISASVYDQVRHKLDLDFEDRGLREVKNIAEPVRTYAVHPKSVAHGTVPDADADGNERLVIADAPSIAVLPFDNMSGDAEQDYFSDGITEDIITDLSKISRLMVIARNSSFTYKGRAVDVKQVARELGVRHVLEGSVRKAGNRVRVTAQLIDGATGGHIWAERYDRVLEDIFAIQDEITLAIVDELKIRLDLGEKNRLSSTPSANIEAYDLALHGREKLMASVSPASMEEATAMFERARALDPSFVAPHVGLAFAHIMAYTNAWSPDPEASLDYALDLAQKAVELDENDALASRAYAVALLWKRRLDEACAELGRATALAPNDAELLATRGNMLVYMHDADAAVENLEKAIRLDPLYPDMWLHFLGHAYFMKGEYETAARYLRERILRQPDTDLSRTMLAAAYGHLGRVEEARRLWKEVFEVNPHYSLEQKERVLPYKDPSDWSRFVDGLKKAGLPR